MSHQEPGQLNPALLIQCSQVLAMELAAGNIFRVWLEDGWHDVRVHALGVDPDGVPCLSLAEAGPDEMDAREAEARRTGGPVAP
jgi:hypothetical protein